ncbi:hypothetical protein WHR41_02289 [Cladosporium halotolerans]|uniref:Origin recognition complex subunit 6 n=1 Tax=Cladosporium halotolerans TaxID=1052096 RepID=A0AB34KVM2_9PEZI
MSAATDLQTLLRFLTQDAKIPLATALSHVKALQAAQLNTIDSIAKAKPEAIKQIFSDEKLSKQVHNAAKRVSKKRAAGDDGAATASSPKKKRSERSVFSLKEEQTPAEIEASLALPRCELEAEELKDVVLFTNRAPLVLAFVVVLLKFSMPEQPLSSRLSLAQAYVSVTSRARAVSLGIESGESAEELGMGLGQASVTIMGKELRVLKRWGYEWEDGKDSQRARTETNEEGEQPVEESPPLWGLDLEALKRSRTEPPPLAKAQSASTTNMPIHTPQAARMYLMKSFDNPPPKDAGSAKKQSTGSKAAEKERNLGMLLRAVELLYESWSQTLSLEELDGRTWGWYVKARPAVQDGVAGWGGKNEVRLADILALRREE